MQFTLLLLLLLLLQLLPLQTQGQVGLPRVAGSKMPPHGLRVGHGVPHGAHVGHGVPRARVPPPQRPFSAPNGQLRSNRRLFFRPPIGNGRGGRIVFRPPQGVNRGGHVQPRLRHQGQLPGTETSFQRSETRRREDVGPSSLQPLHKLVSNWESKRIDDINVEHTNEEDETEMKEEEIQEDRMGQKEFQDDVRVDDESAVVNGYDDQEYLEYYDEDNEKEVDGNPDANRDNHARPRVAIDTSISTLNDKPPLLWSPPSPTSSNQREQTRSLPPWTRPTTFPSATWPTTWPSTTTTRTDQLMTKNPGPIERLQGVPDEMTGLSKLTTGMVLDGRIPVLVRKLAKVPKNRSSDPCENNLLECSSENVHLLDTVHATKKPTMSSMLPFVRLLRHEVWVMPLLFLALLVFLMLFFFELYLVSQIFGHAHQNSKSGATLVVSKRHLFLGQVLLLGLFSCCLTTLLVVVSPTSTTCSLLQLGTGTSYVLIHSSLLVKLVYLLSVRKGVFLPSVYQLLLLFFAMLIQIIIGVQWVTSTPSSTTMLDKALLSCPVDFEEHVHSLLYIFFLITINITLAFRARRIRDNYRESTYIALALFFTVCIFTLWITAGLLVPEKHGDACLAAGLTANAAILFVVMFMPKGRQMVALGREGIYAEDARATHPMHFDTSNNNESSDDEERAISLQSSNGHNHQPASFFPIKQEQNQGKQRRRADTPNTNRAQHRASSEMPVGGGRQFSWAAEPSFTRRPSEVRGGRREGVHGSTSNLVFEKSEEDEALNWALSGGQVGMESHVPRWKSRASSGFLHASLHDLHAANEQRASRSDLREMRDQLRRRQLSHDDLRRQRARDRQTQHQNESCPHCDRDWHS